MICSLLSIRSCILIIIISRVLHSFWKVWEVLIYDFAFQEWFAVSDDSLCIINEYLFFHLFRMCWVIVDQGSWWYWFHVLIMHNSPFIFTIFPKPYFRSSMGSFSSSQLVPYSIVVSILECILLLAYSCTRFIVTLISFFPRCLLVQYIPGWWRVFKSIYD